MQDDSKGELIAGLKVYLEAGRYSRGNKSGTAEAGLVLLANIMLDEDHRPLHADSGIFMEFPNFLRETAFIDRLHGLLPGWELPRVTKQSPSSSIGFKGDFFSEVLHQLRTNTSCSDYVAQNMHLTGSDDLRDHKAITRLATGFMKLLFPNAACSEEEFVEYCLKPAVEMRQRIRNELHLMDAEYPKVTIGIEGHKVNPTDILPAPLVEGKLLEGDIETTDEIQLRIERIAEQFPNFGIQIKKAYNMVASQPDSALVATRKALECVVRPLYTKRIKKNQAQIPLFEMVSELERRGYIPDLIKQHLHTVRTLGNIAAHGDSTSVTSDDAHLAIIAAIRVGEWIVEESLQAP